MGARLGVRRQLRPGRGGGGLRRRGPRPGRDGDTVHARYRMLESIRHYGLDRLCESGADAREAARRRVRDWCLDFVEECERRWFGPDQPELVRRLHAESDTVRAALEFCLSTPGEVRAGLRLAGHLWFFWFATGALTEGRFWLERLLAADPEPTRARARALWSLALMLLSQGDAVRGGPLAEESHALALRLGDETEAAHSFFGRGGALLISGAYERAREVYEEALSRPPLEGESMSLVGFKYVELAHVLSLQGEHGRAMALCAEFRGICLVHGEQWIHSYLLRILAFAEWSQGDQVSARTHARECLRLKRAVGDVFGIGMTLELLAAVHARDGEGRPAAVLLGAARRSGGTPMSPWTAPRPTAPSATRPRKSPARCWARRSGTPTARAWSSPWTTRSATHSASGSHPPARCPTVRSPAARRRSPNSSARASPTSRSPTGWSSRYGRRRAMWSGSSASWASPPAARSPSGPRRAASRAPDDAPRPAPDTNSTKGNRT